MQRTWFRGPGSKRAFPAGAGLGASSASAAGKLPSCMLSARSLCRYVGHPEARCALVEQRWTPQEMSFSSKHTKISETRGFISPRKPLHSRLHVQGLWLLRGGTTLHSGASSAHIPLATQKPGVFQTKDACPCLPGLLLNTAALSQTPMVLH